MSFLSVASCPFLSLLPSGRLFEAPAWRSLRFEERSTWTPFLPVISFWTFQHDSAVWLCTQVHGFAPGLGKDSTAALEGCTGSTCWWLSAAMFPSAASHYPCQGSLPPVYGKQWAITPPLIAKHSRLLCGSQIMATTTAPPANGPLADSVTPHCLQGRNSKSGAPV